VRFHRVYREGGGTVPFDRFESVFRATDDALSRMPTIEHLGLRATLYAQAQMVCEALGDPAWTDPTRVAQLVTAESFATLSRNRPLLENLRAGHRLAVVSNFTGNLATCLAEVGYADLFDAVVDSGRVGVTKPDARIFGIALEALDARAQDAWMIGDNFEADIRPAAALGLAACWLTPNGLPAPDHGIAAVARIARLTDLPGVLA